MLRLSRIFSHDKICYLTYEVQRRDISNTFAATAAVVTVAGLVCAGGGVRSKITIERLKRNSTINMNSLFNSCNSGSEWQGRTCRDWTEIVIGQPASFPGLERSRHQREVSMKEGFNVVGVVVVVVVAVAIVVASSRFFPFFEDRSGNREEVRPSLSQKQETLRSDCKLEKNKSE